MGTIVIPTKEESHKTEAVLPKPSAAFYGFATQAEQLIQFHNKTL
jgi:hypothetical protein